MTFKSYKIFFEYFYSTEIGQQICRHRQKKKIDRNSGKNKDVWVRSSILCVIATKKKKRKTSTTITINKRDLAS